MRPGKLWILVVSSTGQLQLHSPAISSILFSEVLVTATATAKSLQSCPTLCDPIHGSPTGSPIPGTLQARTLEWVAISFSNAWQWKVKVKSLSCVQLLATPWTAVYQAPPSMGFSRQEYWSGVPLPSLESTLGNAIKTSVATGVESWSESLWSKRMSQKSKVTELNVTKWMLN